MAESTLRSLLEKLLADWEKLTEPDGALRHPSSRSTQSRCLHEVRQILDDSSAQRIVSVEHACLRCGLVMSEEPEVSLDSGWLLDEEGYLCPTCQAEVSAAEEIEEDDLVEALVGPNKGKVGKVWIVYSVSPQCYSVRFPDDSWHYWYAAGEVKLVEKG